jgi:hypothetical protein
MNYKTVLFDSPILIINRHSKKTYLVNIRQQDLSRGRRRDDWSGSPIYNGQSQALLCFLLRHELTRGNESIRLTLQLSYSSDIYDKVSEAP